MTIQADHAAFRTAARDIDRAGESLHRARTGIDHDVDQLLGEGWSGIAAQSFAEGWQQWGEAADDVLDGLLAMGRLLTAVHLDLTERDLDAEDGVDEIARRITARLGS